MTVCLPVRLDLIGNVADPNHDLQDPTNAPAPLL